MPPLSGTDDSVRGGAAQNSARFDSAPSALSAAELGLETGRDRAGAPTELFSADVQTEEGRWRVLGVIGRLYVLIESPEGLVLMDQHAAHERVLFERMLRELAMAGSPREKHVA